MSEAFEVFPKTTRRKGEMVYHIRRASERDFTAIAKRRALAELIAGYLNAQLLSDDAENATIASEIPRAGREH